MLNFFAQSFRLNALIPAIVIVASCQLNAAENSHANLLYEVSPAGQVIADTFVGTHLKGATTIAASGQNGWTLIGLADFNKNASPVYYDRTSGLLVVLFLGGPNGTDVRGYGALVTPGEGWTPVAIADLNNDGHPDVLFVNASSGQVDVFFYGGAEGTTFLSRETISPLSVTGWNVVGAADLNGSGHSGLVLQNRSTGQVLVNSLGGTNGTTITATEELVGAFEGWSAAGLQDMNGDGHADLILVNDATGRIMVRYNGGAVGSNALETAYLDTPVSPGRTLMTASGQSAANQPAPDSAQFAPMDVSPAGEKAQVHSVPILIFNGTGTSATDVTAIENIVSAAGFAYNTVNSAQLDGMTQAQLEAYTLFIMPGGNSIKIGDNLKASAASTLHNAVANGLNYLGICAGGFYGGFSKYNGLNLTSGVWFDFFADYYKGIHKEAASISFPAQNNLDIYWQEGPELAQWGYVVGKYKNGTPALAEGHWGKGFVLLSGVHPEAPASWRSGMKFGTSLQVDLAYATTLVKSALNGTMLPHY